MNIRRPLQKLADRLYEDERRELRSAAGNILEVFNFLGMTTCTMVTMFRMLTESHTPAGPSGTSLLLFLGSAGFTMATLYRNINYCNIIEERKWQHIASELIGVSIGIELLKLQNKTPDTSTPPTAAPE